jgi:hypothetical protein
MMMLLRNLACGAVPTTLLLCLQRRSPSTRNLNSSAGSVVESTLPTRSRYRYQTVVTDFVRSFMASPT